MDLKPIWTVRVPKRVGKILSKFPQQDEEQIRAILREFELDPWQGDIVKIRGKENKWRRRVGNYRLFYSIYTSLHIVDIIEIERRASSTY